MRAWIDAPDINNLTALYYAVAIGHGEISFRLLMARSNPNISDETGKSCLHSASAGNFEGILMLLIDFGANIDSRNITGNTPLHVAAGRNSDHCVKFLLKRGANSEAVNKTNQTPFMIAHSADLPEIAELIQDFEDRNIGKKLMIHKKSLHQKSHAQ